jgi:hypothetical protein
MGVAWLPRTLDCKVGYSLLVALGDLIVTIPSSNSRALLRQLATASKIVLYKKNGGSKNAPVERKQELLQCWHGL